MKNPDLACLGLFTFSHSLDVYILLDFSPIAFSCDSICQYTCGEQECFQCLVLFVVLTPSLYCLLASITLSIDACDSTLFSEQE